MFLAAGPASERSRSAAEVMLHVRQRNTFDCGVAVVATLAQVPYDAVLDRLITGLSSSSPLREIVVWRSLEDITQGVHSHAVLTLGRADLLLYPRLVTEAA